MNERFFKIESKYHELTQKIEKQEIKIHNFEKEARKRNIIFFGIEETEKSYNNLESIILDIINNKMKINCENRDIEYCRRLGRKGTKIRPVAVTLSTMGKKIELLKNKKLLSNSKFYIKEDYPPEVLIKRKELQEQLQEEISKGNKAFIKYDKIIILSENNKENRKSHIPNRKRSLSKSPQNSSKEDKAEEQHSNTSKQPQKRNRYDIKRFLNNSTQSNINE